MKISNGVNKKILISGSFGLLALLILIILIVSWFNKTLGNKPNLHLDSKPELKNEITNENQTSFWKPDLFFDIPLPSSPFSQTQPSKNQTPKEKISTTAKEILSLIKNEQSTIENQTLSEKKESFSKKPLTEEEIFEFIYPDYYRDYLNKIQLLMIEDRFLKPEKEMVFKNEDEIFAFLEKGIDYWILIGVIEPKQKEKFLKGLTLLKLLNQEEAKYYRMGYLGKFLKSVSNLLTKFLKRPVWAQVDCFRSGLPTPGGANLWAPCCKCKCGPYNCGCLNAVCPYGSAIWDPMTGICGCG